MLSTALITAPSFDETAGICAIVAVVDTRSLAGARNHCEGSVPIIDPLQHQPYSVNGCPVFFWLRSWIIIMSFLFILPKNQVSLKSVNIIFASVNCKVWKNYFTISHFILLSPDQIENPHFVHTY
jgi:hypothetical protein